VLHGVVPICDEARRGQLCADRESSARTCSSPLVVSFVAPDSERAGACLWLRATLPCLVVLPTSSEINLEIAIFTDTIRE
jgi:hypothetical protein